ncbi:MAG: malto-oligosyltrehalose trehalohydrolase [Chlamydiales bacterium]|nr:malto-oligosyltrehalose trehalohydrolase [Chlamydiales bacterium]
MVKTEVSTWQLDLGANPDEKGKTTFKVWAPHHTSLFLRVVGKETYPMVRASRGFYTFESDQIEPGDHYFYVMGNGLARPDPVSRFLPQGLHGPTEVVDPSAYKWNDMGWKGIALRDAILYELHIGVSTPEGTFEALIDKLDYFKELGINCIEIMPLAQFPGRFNWGYDGASLYVPFKGYGGVEGFKRFVDACHQNGIAVCLDVVYNHLGPEGNYLEEFGPYFSETYHTPWGKAFNYDGAFNDCVREYVIKNALHWIVEYHVDMLRLDAIHGIYDFSPMPMLPELCAALHQISESLGRQVHVIAESGQNNARVVRSGSVGGWDICAIWNDDFHHSSHVALTGEATTYYRDFTGLADLSAVLTKNFVFDGKYSPFLKRRHGCPSADIPFEKFIVFLQNHDQTGNRPMGDRLSTLVNKNRLKIAACLTLLSPSIPMLFMGEEYGERAPFEYFVDYENENLMRSIYEGRKREFHRREMPFPGKESFENSKLTWKGDKELFALYKSLIGLRKQNLPKAGLVPSDIHVYFSPEEEWISWEYPTRHDDWIGVFVHLGSKKLELEALPFQKVKGELIASTQAIKEKWQLFADICLILK